MKREVSNGTQVHACPMCGTLLVRDGDLLTCSQHGAFFAYGPQLVVRAPAQHVRLQNAPLPWEMLAAKARGS